MKPGANITHVYAVALVVIILLAFDAISSADAFATSIIGPSTTVISTILYQSHRNDCEQSPNIIISRREMVQSALSACFVLPTLASAENLPSSNGADLSQTGSIDTLTPIVSIQRSISSAKLQLDGSSEGSSSIVTPTTCANLLQPLLKSIPRDEKSFKRIFDSYSTPVSYKQKFLDQNAFLVYYTKGFDGPGRANIEEDTNGVQTLQYGSRNDAWAAMDDLLVELEFGQKSKNDESALSTKGELAALIDKVLGALDSYLSLAPAEDVKEASKRLG